MIRSGLALPIALLLCSLDAAALQIVDARDGETVFAKISQKELTRIGFERGRIRRVTGNAGEFLMEKDEDRGLVFVRPAPGITKPVNIFVSSDRGTVALLLQPVDGPGDTIVIRESRPAGTRSERAGRHVRGIKHLMLAMANDLIPDDLEIRETRRAFSLRTGLRLDLERQFVASDAVGEKFRLVNTGTTTAEIAPADLYRPGVMAVSVEHGSLPGGQTTNVFLVRERRADE